MQINKCKDVENLADEIVIECNAEQEGKQKMKTHINKIKIS